MNKQEVLARIAEIGIVPVVRASSPKQAVDVSLAIAEGGVPVTEITMTVPGALKAIAELSQKAGDKVLVGAGTVLDIQSARACIDAGAKFLVSPGFDYATVQLARQLNVPIMAGSLTPTEVINAWKAGADVIKIFPCGNLGGAKYIKALKAPLPNVPMVPTGGVNLQTAADFIKAGALALGVGGELVSPKLVEAGDFAAIATIAKQYYDIVQAARA